MGSDQYPSDTSTTCDNSADSDDKENAEQEIINDALVSYKAYRKAMKRFKKTEVLKKLLAQFNKEIKLPKAEREKLERKRVRHFKRLIKRRERLKKLRNALYEKLKARTDRYRVLLKRKVRIDG